MIYPGRFVNWAMPEVGNMGMGNTGNGLVFLLSKYLIFLSSIFLVASSDNRRCSSSVVSKSLMSFVT